MIKRNAQIVHVDSFRGDTHINAMKGITLTLTTANVVTVVSIPDYAIGFKIYPLANDVLFGVNITIGPRMTSNGVTIPVSDLHDGSVAKPGIWEVRVLPDDTGRLLYLRSATALTVLELDFWG